MKMQTPSDAPPTVYVDFRPAVKRPTGVGHFTKAIVEPIEASWRVHKLTPPTTSPSKLMTALRAGYWHVRTFWTVRRDPTSVYLSTESLIVPTLLGRQSVLVIHDLSPFLFPKHHTVRNRLAHALIFNLAARRTAKIIVPSAAVKNDLLERLPGLSSKTRVIPEASRYQPASGLHAREKICLYVGTIEPRKNVDVLIRAFAAAGLIGWRLVIAGKMGWLSASQRADIESLFDSPGVEYVGYQSDRDLLSLYRTASLFAYISESEGFGLPPLEAMSQGLAVIISNDPALIEVAGEAAEVIELGRDLQKTLSKRLQHLASDESLIHDLRRKAMARASEYSWERSAEALSQILAECRSDFMRAHDGG